MQILLQKKETRKNNTYGDGGMRIIQLKQTHTQINT